MEKFEDLIINNKSEKSNQNEQTIKIETPIGSKKEEDQKEIDSKRFLEEEREKQKIDEKLEEGTLLSQKDLLARNLERFSRQEVNAEKNIKEEKAEDEKEKTSKDFEKELLTTKQDIQDNEFKKREAQKNIDKLDSILNKFNPIGRKERKTKSSIAENELEIAKVDIESADDKYGKLIREYGSSLEKEEMPKGEILVKMMGMRDNLAQEKLEQKEKEKGVFLKLVDKYNKLPLKYKLAITAAMIGGGVLTGMAGGSVAAAGSLALGSAKIFESMAAGIGAAGIVEGFEKKKEKKIQKEGMEKMTSEYLSGKNLLEIWDNKSLELDQRIEKNQRKGTIAKWLVGGGVGIGTFLLSGGHKDFASAASKMKGSWLAGANASGAMSGKTSRLRESFEMGKEISPKVEKGLVTPVTATENVKPVRNLGQRFHKTVVESTKATEQSFEEIAKKGDTVWGIMKQKLSGNSDFKNLDPQKQNYLLDSLRRKIASDPESIGLAKGANIDKIGIGQKLNFQKVIEDKGMLNQLFEKAKKIPSEKLVKQGEQIFEKTISERPFTGGGIGNVVEHLADTEKNIGQEILKKRSTVEIMDALGTKEKINLAAEKLMRERSSTVMDQAKRLTPEIKESARGTINELWKKLVGKEGNIFLNESLDAGKKIAGSNQFTKREWDLFNKLSVEKVLDKSFAKFGAERVSGVLDATELANRKTLQKILETLNKDAKLNPIKGENVLSFLRRAKELLK